MTSDARRPLYEMAKLLRYATDEVFRAGIEREAAHKAAIAAIDADAAAVKHEQEAIRLMQDMEQRLLKAARRDD